MIIYFATGNRHKQQEMQALLTPHTVLISTDSGLSFHPEENGSTFIENSLIKARALWEMTGKPALADDSGICVDALDGRPGIFSARYANGAPNQNELLINEVNEVLAAKGGQGHKSRAIRFVCALTLYLGNERFFAVQETLEGTLVESIAQAGGSGGFGYDPVFFLPEYGKTVAELSSEEKNTISHRAKAARLLRRLFETEINVE